MTVARERLIALAALVFCVLVMATSVEMGRNAIQSTLSGLTAYGTVVALAALGLTVGVGKILKATKSVLLAAVLIGAFLIGTGKALAGVIG